MSKESEIMREHLRTHRTVLSMCNEPEDVVLNRLLDDFHSKDQRIAELEEQLKNVIVPKFKIGQEVWYIDRYGVQKDTIVSFTYFSIENEILYKMHDEIIDHREKYIFATKEEALKKLEELKGE